ncbi:MAG: M48 family metalloprotease [Dysgonomonas sp.]
MNIQPSSNFKKMAINAIVAIITFIFVYLILLILGIALTALCIYGGIALIIAAPKFITIAIGIGLSSLGIIIFIFLIKFLFKEHEIDKSHLTEVYRKEYPELFNFIEEIAIEAKVKSPKKIYFSRDVNAAVFYNSSFWSMFFPVRKNLQIGLGLVNTVTEQELKAIIAHEFGHFSQRSMSVGSYVYNVNEVIFNMLYDNNSFDQTIQAWANISGYFSIFVIIAVKIIHGIQWILKKMYGLINIRYMALSREMEFHADEVAANIAGSKPLIDSLLRLELSQFAYNSTLNFYEHKSENNIISKNIYKDQLYTLELLAKENNIPLKDGLPLVTVSDINKSRSKIKIEDQWASHPSTEERVDALRKLNITKNENRENLAIALLPDKEKIGEELTKLIFYYSTFRKETVVMDNEEFRKDFQRNIIVNQFPKEYNTYYDNKNPISFDLEKITNFELSYTIDILFQQEKVDIVYNLIALEADKSLLESISKKEIEIKSFHYGESTYNARQAEGLIVDINKETEDYKSLIKENDINIYKFF